MANSPKFREFNIDRQDFFANDIKTINVKLAQKCAAQKEYKFLQSNLSLIEEEFNQLFTTLKENGKDRKEFWVYCFYCSLMMKNYYLAYGNNIAVEKYNKLSDELKDICEGKALPKNEDDFLKALNKKILDDLKELASTPFHTTKIRNWLGYVNLNRINYAFCRSTVKQFLLFANEIKWIETLSKMSGSQINIDGMVATINSVSPIFNILSVGLFAMRLMINTGIMLKHTLMQSNTDMKTRFFHELDKRHIVMLNDIAWGTVNFVTNFPGISQISAAAANWLTLGFLIFDFSIVMYQRCRIEKEYLLKKSQLTAEINRYRQESKSDLDSKHIDVLKEELALTEGNFQKANASLMFSAAASTILTTSFTASFILATPATTLICLFCCTVAVAMYLTSDAYGNYREKALHLMQEDSKGENRKDKAQALFNTARNDFYFNMGKNIVMPFFIVSAFATSWPAALALTLAYVGYEYVHGIVKILPSAINSGNQSLPYPYQVTEPIDITDRVVAAGI